MWARLICVALLGFSTPALAHQLQCDETVGRVRTDGAGAPVLGQDGLPVFTGQVAPVLVLQDYPASVGFRVRVRNTAADTSVITRAWHALREAPAQVTWSGDPFAAGTAFAVGASAEGVATIRVSDRDACLALLGAAPPAAERVASGGSACFADRFQDRFVVEHEAGSAECRALVICGPERPPGPAWTLVPSGTTDELRGVWGSGPDDVWAVGAWGTILHWDGAAWSAVQSGTSEWLGAIWGSGPEDVWAVGTGLILHWDGTAWSTVVSEPDMFVRSVWGSAKDDVWATGDGFVLHWDGAAWSAARTGLDTSVIGVWGSGADDVWTGAHGAVHHWDGSAWLDVPLPGDPEFVRAVWGAASDDVWAAGNFHLWHFDGSGWADVVLLPTSVTSGLWGSARDDVWAVGLDEGAELEGQVLHWDGGTWTPAAIPPVAPLGAVWGSAAGDVWAVGGGGAILRFH